MTCAKCGKTPTKKTIATKTSQLGDHIVVDAKRDALVCDCGVLAWDPPVQTTPNPLVYPIYPRPFVYPVYPQPITSPPPSSPPQTYPQQPWMGGQSPPLPPSRGGTLC